jgi:hypothetical protein
MFNISVEVPSADPFLISLLPSEIGDFPDEVSSLDEAREIAREIVAALGSNDCDDDSWAGPFSPSDVTVFVESDSAEFVWSGDKI